MKLDVFTEIQKRDCDLNGGFSHLLEESLEQARVADEVGFDCWWEVEHHCTPDFSYSSCPELILGAIALNTKRLRIGHAGVLAPFGINHPLRVAERLALLDHLSNGRLEAGLAKSGGKEWETFGISEADASLDLQEVTQLLPAAWTQTPFEWCSPRFTVESRDVQPKPLQQPHPRLWHTCSSPPSFERAGSMGVGVLGTTLFAPLEALAQMIETYRSAIAGCELADGMQANDQVGVFTFVHVAETEAQAIASGAPRSALWYVSSAPRVFNVPRNIFYDAIRGNTDPRSRPSTAALAVPERPDDGDVEDSNPVVSLLKREFRGEELSNEEIYEVLKDLDSVIIGDVATCRRKMSGFRDIGVDRLMCLMQMGEVPHDKVVSSMRRIGRELIPHFAD
ncbi:MAG: LLM class flavin-dependent oxidoreductase [Gammaproteobacteria bacterium]|nr:MAG: LLM class flavin-dependent oxidoreductase [Gammaproteobacteria bacterium]